MINFGRKIAAGLLAATTLAGAAGPALGALCGDLNGNGSRNVADVVLLFRAVLENPDPTPLCGGLGALDCGDTNADSNISVNDVVILFSSVLGNETLYPLCTGPGNVISCPGGTATVSGSITTNQVWPSSCTILVDGTVFVEPGVVLTIQPGTTIKGKKSPSNPPPSAIVFRRDSKINAVGTAAAPIVFTSDQSPGARAPGDWGGIVLNGRAPVNCPGGECLAEGLSGTPFGGAEPN
ncbi:MAG: dockerin type I repeat-containing protein, partial [Alphaproteobacteria bacterium]